MLCRFILIPSLLFFSVLQAEDLGVFQETFSIKEESLEETVEKVSKEILKEAVEKSKKAIEKGEYTPQAVQIPACENSWEHYFDPSVTLEEDLYDIDGKLLVLKGERVNPLDHISLDETLIFFDADEEAQIEWAKGQKGKTFWILTSGNPFKLMKEEKREVYFDQMGALVNKFAISSIPARVFQEGKRMRVEEICVY